MSTHTEQSPFEFEGVNVFHDSGGMLDWRVTWGDEWPSDGLGTVARALHAFIEAERTGWHWTNSERTEARSGRWYVTQVVTDTGFSVYKNWVLKHDDFPDFKGHLSTNGKPTSKGQAHYELRLSWWREMQGFLTWRAEQDVPETTVPAAEIAKFFEDMTDAIATLRREYVGRMAKRAQS